MHRSVQRGGHPGKVRSDPAVRLLYGVVKVTGIHPDEVREMDYEDVVGLAAYSEWEAEQVKSETPSAPGMQVTGRYKRR
jgi:hypothetical protein